MHILVSFAALFISAFLIQVGSGSLGPLDALSGAALGWTTPEIGLLGSAHFAGVFIGCWAMPRLIGWSGHSRAFATSAAVGAIGVVLHPVLQGPEWWAALSLFSDCNTLKLPLWLYKPLELALPNPSAKSMFRQA